MRRRELLVTVTAGLALFALPMGAARANHIKIEGSPQPAVMPYPAPAPAQTVHADHITAQQIRADTIYANKIDADNIVSPTFTSFDWWI